MIRPWRLAETVFWSYKGFKCIWWFLETIFGIRRKNWIRWPQHPNFNFYLGMDYTLLEGQLKMRFKYMNKEIMNHIFSNLESPNSTITKFPTHHWYDIMSPALYFYIQLYWNVYLIKKVCMVVIGSFSSSNDDLQDH